MKAIIHFIFKAWIRCTTWFYFERVRVEGIENIPYGVPVILASNHPDSFLDALLITSYYNRPVYYMARGDVFANKTAASMLKFLNIIPIYRKEEGAENLSKNEDTFAFCIDAFKEDGSVVIFSEGGSENKWELRPLRKGTARLAYDTWHKNEIGKELQVLPVSINYSSWLGVNVVAYLSFSKPIKKDDFPQELEQGLFLRRFNEKLTHSLHENCVIADTHDHIDAGKTLVHYVLKNFSNGKVMAQKLMHELKTGSVTIKERITATAGYIRKHKLHYSGNSNVLLFLIGIVVYDMATILNFIPYSICHYISKRTTRMNEFYDSVMYCLLLFVYPIYLILLYVAILIFTNWIFALVIVTITLITAKLREWGRRKIHCFVKRKQIKVAEGMLNGLFEKGNG